MACYREGSDYCEHCGRQVLVRQEEPNHVLHLLLSLFCCGWWVFVWLIVTLSAASNPWRCSRCGQHVLHRGGSGILGLLILGAVGVLVIFGVGGCIIAMQGTREPRSERREAGAPPADPEPRRPPDQNVPAGAAPEPRPNAVDAGAAVELVYRAFVADRLAAARKYQGQRMTATGVVVTVGDLEHGDPHATIDVGEKGLLLDARFRPELARKVRDVHVDDRVKVRGRVGRESTSNVRGVVMMQLLECELIVLSEPRPKLRPEMNDQPRDPDAPQKAIYVRIIAVLEAVEQAAVKKYGRKPSKDDNASFTVPYQAFVERETNKAMIALATDLGRARPDLDGIKAEGDMKNWPKR